MASLLKFQIITMRIIRFKYCHRLQLLTANYLVLRQTIIAIKHKQFYGRKKLFIITLANIN